MDKQRIKQLREWARLFEGGAWVHRGINDLADELEAEREQVRQMEEALHRILAIANDKNLGPRTTVGRIKEEALRTLESSATREARNT